MSIPADHKTTAETLGSLAMTKMIVTAGFNYMRTMKYLLTKRSFKDFSNFLYTKILVPTGEGSGELAYYFIGEMLQKHPQLVPYPKYIEIEMTSKCNKHCIICEHTHWNEPSVDLTYSDFVALVDQFDLKWVNLTGEGDAFLNKDYLKMISYLKNKGTSVYLVDSMDLVTPDKSEQLVRMGVDGIYLSIDGATKDTYEKIKVGCNYDRMLTNVRGLLNAKKKYNSPIPEICVRFVVNKLNVHEMGEYVKLIQSLGTRKEWGDCAKIHFVGLLDFPAIHHLCLDEVPRKYIDEALATSTDLPVVFAHLQNESNPNINTCLAWMEPYFALVPHPMVLPCCAVVMSNSREQLSKMCFGNYTEESMKDIWNHPYYKWFRRQVTKPNAPVPALCAGCRAYDTTEREKRYGIDYRTRKDFE